jgi:Leucine-rich repeat (LRR) protein
MFFLGFPIIAHMDRFINLTKLKIIEQDLSDISGLSSCLLLEELWICECKLTVNLTQQSKHQMLTLNQLVSFEQRIEGLSACKRIKTLLLYSNKIAKIENLGHLNLTKLWLNCNKIARIEGLEHMSELKDLNLARNCIRTLGIP